MKKNNKKGFTLVELVIVVAVMAVLVAVAIPTVQSITKTAKDTVADTNARTIESVIKLAEAEASKDGDAVATLSSRNIWDALTDAKLGIETGSFEYDVATGTVVAKEKPAGSTATNAVKFAITFATANGTTTLTVTDGTTSVNAAATGG